jgi:NAD(P)-dependent dehydrogenase (short-subunit alcohol dehydrogenase family)
MSSRTAWLAIKDSPSERFRLTCARASASRDRTIETKPIPLGRVGDAAGAASVIAFLASDAASCVTGTSINIDGGSSGVI